MPSGTVTDEFVHVAKGLGPNGRIAVVRFDRGIKANPLSTDAMRQLRRAAESFEDDLDTSVVILTGNGTAFSAGADLKDARPATSSIVSPSGTPSSQIDHPGRSTWISEVLRPS